uniref:tetratricopeptide repeat protein n=1 Tax=Candidatus Electronema sp. TaxID=2698783 RepID=UPI0040562FFA
MKKINATLFITALVLLVYSNTFQSSWQFDDEPNILFNSNLHISELTFEQINRSMRAHPSSLSEGGKLYRPLPCLTFGLNWYLGQDSVFGYHAVNLVIHILTAWFLFLTLRLLLRIHDQKKENSGLIDTAALLAALFWALAPIQTQAVTYIVQRMASMAAMFGIAVIYAYLRGRTAAKGKIGWFALSLMAFFAALGSKENAIMLLPSLVLIEAAFFKHSITKRQIVRLVLALVFILPAAFFFVHYGLGLTPFSLSNPLRFLDDYSNRSFTFSQRILTQPRILLMYLSQIFFPVADRLSFEHEIILSTSLFSPWTTLPSIAAILGLIGGAIFFLKKYPLVCFPVLFYFLNHAVESTILQLELVFEHRNYLPSLFLFLPVGAAVARILCSNPPQPDFRQTAAAVCAAFFLIISGHATYTRNMVWATSETLWTDAIRKAPNSARAAAHLGQWYDKQGQKEKAYQYFQLSLANAKHAPSPKYATTIALNLIGSLHYSRQENENALVYFNKCINIDQDNIDCTVNRILVYLHKNQNNLAFADAKNLSGKYPYFVKYRYLSALSLYQAKDFDEALNTIANVAKQLDDHQVMQLTGVIFLKKQDYQSSLFFLRKAEEIFPSLENKINLAIISYLAGYQVPLDKIIHAIFAGYKKENIDLFLKEDRYNILTEDMRQYFYDKFEKLAYHHEQQTSSP